MRQINLKSDHGVSERKTRISLSLVIGLLLLIISGLVWGGLFLYEMQLEKNISIANNEIKQREQDVDGQKFREIYDFQGRIVDLKKYFSDSNSQREILDIISSRTFGDTVFNDLSIEQSSPSSSVVKASIMLKDAKKLASQLNAYKQSEQIVNLKLENSSLEEEGVSASLVFTVNNKSSVASANGNL